MPLIHTLRGQRQVDMKCVRNGKRSNGSQNKLWLAHNDCGEFPGSVILCGYQAAAARDWIASPKCGSHFISFPHQQNEMKWGILEMAWNIIADIAIIRKWSDYYTGDLAVWGIYSTRGTRPKSAWHCYLKSHCFTQDCLWPSSKRCLWETYCVPICAKTAQICNFEE